MVAVTMTARPLRVLVVDDSAYNRQTIAAMLSEAGHEVVGRAVDGEEALRLAFSLKPDVITLDLEMPKLDGFGFLRLLMARRPTPVIVISSNSGRETVFKALELGALDFVAKPAKQISTELRGIKDDLLAKVQLVTRLRLVSLTERHARTIAEGSLSGAHRLVPPKAPPGEERPLSAAPVAGPSPARVVAIGASTGGPPAISQILAALDHTLPAAVLITQHMPTRFTKAFADRLNRTTAFEVREAESGDVLAGGRVLIAPGSSNLLLRPRERDGTQRVDVVAPDPGDRFIPSVDRMFESVAWAAGIDALAVVLTGMGGDGSSGVRAIKQRGGRVIAEAAETAVIFGMPQEAIATGVVDQVLPLGQIAEHITRFARRS